LLKVALKAITLTPWLSEQLFLSVMSA
jgi:hypothetical protein